MGSLGQDGAYATVENVYVKNCSFNGTQNGVRIKTWQVMHYTELYTYILAELSFINSLKFVSPIFYREGLGTPRI